MAEKHIADAEFQFFVVNVNPDFCKVGKKVIPFDIMQVLEPEKANYAKTVFARKKQVLMIDSIIKAVNGNAGKGVLSGVSLALGDNKVIEGANTVYTEGRLTARHLDEVLMNGVFASGTGGGSNSKLGESVDKLIDKSPNLKKDLEELKKDGWEVRYGEDGNGSFASREDKIITLDGKLKDDPLAATQTLAHEVGHAKYPYAPDYATKSGYVNGALADEGAATVKNIQVQREIIANGGPNIGIAGNSANHTAYNAAYDGLGKEAGSAAANNAVGAVFGKGEITSTTGQSYADYYGGWYDKTYPPK